MAVHVGLFQNMTAVHWKDEPASSSEQSEAGGPARCGLIVQVGRWRTGASTVWEVTGQAGSSPAIDCGQYHGTTDPVQWDYPDGVSDPAFFKLAFNLPAYDTVIVGEGGVAGSAGNRAAAFNFQRQLAALGSLPEVVQAQLELQVFSFGSNTAQWHFAFDTFEIALAGSSASDPAHDLGIDPTFSQGTEPDSTAARFGTELIGSAPIWIPDATILDTARLYVPHTSDAGIFTGGTVTCFINTITGQISAVEPP